MTATHEQTDLVKAFLAKVSDRSGQEIGREVPGVTADDVSRWRRGNWEWLSGKKVRALRRFLSDHASSNHTGSSSGAIPTYLQRASDFDRRLHEILGSDLDGLTKSGLIVDVALALRAEGLRERGMALRIEAEAARIEAEAAARRQDDLAAERARAAEAERKAEARARAAKQQPSAKRVSGEQGGG